MKFAIPTAMVPVGEIKELALAAEINGFHSIAVSDHLFHPKQFSVPYPYTPDGRVRWEEGTDWPDPINLLSFLAGATKNLHFYTSIYILPARNILRVAKEIATLSNLSKGRFSLGIGLGWLPEEFELGGVPFKNRGKRADEMLEILQALWKGDFVQHEGTFHTFKSLQSLPTPHKNTVPILVGGYSDAALTRAAKHDGWISDMHSLRELKDLIIKLEGFKNQIANTRAYQIIAFSCWDAFHKEGFLEMFDIGVTTITTYPWFMYGLNNNAPLKDKLKALEKFSKDIIL
ncbi:MAG: TIGR03619 family F420-dependent LLM class oxidoreductase [Gammaproteobacteria bacterium]